MFPLLNLTFHSKFLSVAKESLQQIQLLLELVFFKLLMGTLHYQSIYCSIQGLICQIFKPPRPPWWLLLGSPMLLDPHHSQQHAGLQDAVLRLQQEVTRPSLPKKSGVDGGAIRWQHILVSCFTTTTALTMFNLGFY